MVEAPVTTNSPLQSVRDESYGQRGSSIVDRFGVYLSKRTILRHIPRGTLPRLLDIGCGYHATLLRAMQPSLQSGVGVDVKISDAARQTPRLTFNEGKIEDVLPSLPEASFDVIMFISVLEHLWRPQEALNHCHRLLNDNGVLLLNVPSWRGKFFLEFSAFKLGTSPAQEMDDHKMYYDKRDLWPLLIQAGFKPSQVRLHYHKFGLNLFAVAVKAPHVDPH